MTVFLVNIPSVNKDDKSYPLCYEILKDYFDKHKIKHFVLSHNDYDNIHPAWLKMKCFDYVDDDFILCWDMDLIPRKNCPSIENYLKMDNINIVRDSMFSGYTNDFKNIIVNCHPNFKYNTGLVGIPKKYKYLLEETFNCPDKNIPANEQFPFNDILAKHKIDDINVLDDGWNKIHIFVGIQNCYTEDTKLIHYIGMRGDEERYKLVKHHYDVYNGKET